MRFHRLLPLLFLSLSACTGEEGTEAVAAEASGVIAGIEEPSGVVRHGDRLYIVGDDEAGTYYTYPLEGDETGRVPLDPRNLRRHELAAGEYAIDLEAIDVLADGRTVVISERLAALFDDQGFVARYKKGLAEVGGRGLEGIAVRPLSGGASQVAVLWEGGYLDSDHLPEALADLRLRALRPIVTIHDLDPGDTHVAVRKRNTWKQFELRVPRPEGREPQAQRFRAPDLVWHRWKIDGQEDIGIIVLISSGYSVKPGKGSIEECIKEKANGGRRKYCFKWLQRFTLDGLPYGEPFDLEEALPEVLRTENWEGLGWFEPGESLVLVYDEKLKSRAVDPQEAFVLPLPSGW